MKTSFFCATALMGITLCSCVRITPGVPDMPYNAAQYSHRDVQPAPAPVATPTVAPTTPAATPAAQKPTTPAPAPAVQKPVKPAPAPAADTKKPLDLTKPITTETNPEPTEPKPAPVVTPPAPAPVTVTEPKPAPKSSGITTSDSGVTPPPAITPEAPKKITNKDGHIPTAMRVEGDPTRVYNPLDPSKTIRVIDKNGNPYPSGKELKVRGTDYHFYVP